jgi:hypothetical protein
MEDAKEEKGRQPGATGTSTAEVLEENRSLAELNREEFNNTTHTHTHTHRTKTDQSGRLDC